MKVFSSLSSGQKTFTKTFIFIFLILFLHFFVVSNTHITTENMSPNLKSGDFVFGLRLGYVFPLLFTGGQKFEPLLPERGDLISFRFPGDEKQLIIRRVIALPGDKLSLKKDILSLNDKKATYDFFEKGQKTERLPGQKHFHVIKPDFAMNLDLMVPQGHVFVLSDHRESRDDSRDWGFVPVRNIESRLGLIWFSVDKKKNLNWSRFFLLVR